MSIFSDYRVGALSDWEFEEAGKRMNAQDRYEREHMYEREHIDDWERYEEDEEGDEE